MNKEDIDKIIARLPYSKFQPIGGISNMKWYDYSSVEKAIKQAYKQGARDNSEEKLNKII